MPTSADYRTCRTLHGNGELDLGNPLVSFVTFPGSVRERYGLKDSEALKRHVDFGGKDRHAAGLDSDRDACNKAITCGLTKGVFNIVCPLMITLSFRCLFWAECAGKALSIVLKRFPELREVIFYDAACKLDENALRRVRPILSSHGMR